jgi:hypothetical protein
MITLTDKQYTDRLSAAINLRQQGYYSQAGFVIRDLLQLRPEESSVWHQVGQLATVTGDAEGAVTGFGRSLELLREHGSLQTHTLQFQATSLGYGQSLMRLGHFGEAWPYFESGRMHVSWSPWPTTEYWDGSTEGIPSLLVQSEGGYGDIFMFMRWLPRLKSVRGVGRVGLMIFPGLADTFNWKALGVDEVYVVDRDKIPFGQWRYSVSIMSLGACFGMTKWLDIPDPGGTDTLSDEKAFPVQLPFCRDGRSEARRVGFCWRAEENSSPIKTKSLSWETAGEVVRLLGQEESIMCDVLSLSPEKKDLYNALPFRQPAGMIYEPENMNTWLATARYLMSMDYVLTVDTAVGHLCGLLGVNALVLVPRGGCWRFGTEDADRSHWYGQHISLYRQRKVLEWDAADIVRSLAEKIEEVAV